MFLTKNKFEKFEKNVNQDVHLLNNKLKTLEERLESLIKTIDNITNNKNNLEERLENIERNLEDYLNYTKRKESIEPYIEIISDTFDPNEGLELKLDWNESMINFLKRQGGYTGTTDEDIVQQYILDLFKEQQKNKNYE